MIDSKNMLLNVIPKTMGIDLSNIPWIDTKDLSFDLPSGNLT
jgi:hypothetical protein